MTRTLIALVGGGAARTPAEPPAALHPLLGRPLLEHVLQAARPLDADPPRVVAGPGHHRLVAEFLDAHAPSAVPVRQRGPRGAGQAVGAALDTAADADGTVLVLTGDVPLLRSGSLLELARAHEDSGAAATVLTGAAPVAHAFDARVLRAALSGLRRRGGERAQSLADLVGAVRTAGHEVRTHPLADPAEALRCRDQVRLAEARAVLRERINRGWLERGVAIIEPAATWIDATVELTAGVTVEPGVHLRGRTTVAARAVIGPDTTLEDTEVGPGARVVRAHAVGARIGAGADVGPYAYLRPGADLGPRTRVGAFVEVKESVLGAGTQVAHLAYVGNATLGADVNIGAGTTFSLYDGVAKHATQVGDAAFIGCNTSLVAPVQVGAGAFVAAGSVVTERVPSGSLAVGRARQVNKPGWVARRRPGTVWAAAAGSASAD
ncbi:bifunctional protein GlmU [Kitasatospora phosalacinea]|uniref:Bifunctional protein GlmU n=1 Tax=Kitasatospora phosalacinea TaxID=2065 RepID=A0A9W6QEI5_9ACTN|nr:NTP transferase domain-containing protein [Kitasatospora phosalacinea]GLW74066.1 bifunctional protein GlmU [Kitasatospora phosalacinea]